MSLYYLYFFGKKLIVKKLSTFSSELYYTIINPIESYVVMNQKFNDPNNFILWHERVGHPRSSMMCGIIGHSHGHLLKNEKILLPNEYPCTACLEGKLIVRPLFSKVTFESPVFLEIIYGDICGPIHPPCGPFCYLMVLIDVSMRWFLSTRNVVFVRLIAQMIKL